MCSAEMKNQANIDAAQSAPTTFATARLRTRQKRSGMSGAATRDSMKRKAASSSAATASNGRLLLTMP